MVINNSTTIDNTILELVEGNITQQNTDAVVNAANETLLGGGGVDGAIHRAGGPAILEECRRLNGCKTGDAKITTGGKLQAKYVIHTVGPVYKDGKQNEPELLSSCYTRSLEVACNHNLSSISFPSISTGAYGYPMEQAAAIALKTIIYFIKKNQKPKLVRIVLFGDSTFQIWSIVLNNLQ